MKKVLIIEDEFHIAHLMELELKRHDYYVDICLEGKSGLEAALSGKYDIIILDLMLPNIDGITVCTRIREKSTVPIIMVTARDSVFDKIKGLDCGADDYLTKPFDMEELCARVRSILRRNDDNSLIITYSHLTLNIPMHSVKYMDEEISLTLKEFNLLLYLLKNKNRAITRDELLEKVWGFEYFGDTNVVDVYIRYLRSKIDDVYNIKLIETVRGVGYIIRDENKQ